MIVSLPNLCDDHGIVTKCLLDFPHGLHLDIAKLLAKFDAVPLVMPFHHFTANGSSQADCQWLMYSAGKKKFTHANEGPLYSSHWREPPVLFYFHRKKIRSDTFWTGLLWCVWDFLGGDSYSFSRPWTCYNWLDYWGPCLSWLTWRWILSWYEE